MAESDILKLQTMTDAELSDHTKVLLGKAMLKIGDRKALKIEMFDTLAEVQRRQKIVNDQAKAIDDYR